MVLVLAMVQSESVRLAFLTTMLPECRCSFSRPLMCAEQKFEVCLLLLNVHLVRLTFGLSEELLEMLSAPAQADSLFLKVQPEKAM